MEFIFFTSFGILSVKYILFWTYVWQLKEYRLDRFFDFLRSKEGKGAFLNAVYLFKVLFVFCGAAFLRTGERMGTENWKSGLIYNIFFFAGLIFILFEAGIFLLKAIKRNIIAPVFTKKAILFCGLSFLFYFIPCWLFMKPQNWQSDILFGILLLLLAPVFAALTNLIISPFSTFLKKRKSHQAMELVKNFQGVAIGITGSYGKTSVKELTAALLEKKFNILKTPKNVNTEIGIANFILAKNFSQISSPHQERGRLNTSPNPSSERRGGFLPLLEGELERVFRARAEEGFISNNTEGQKEQIFFICEMGAYKIGEITAICRMVRPRVGILTGINEQHIALFGSIENTIKAKAELLGALPAGGLAIVNNDDKNCHKVKIPVQVRKVTYGFSEGSDCRALFDDGGTGRDAINRVSTVADFEENQEFTVEYRGQTMKMKLHISSKQNIMNLLPAIIIAREFGVEFEEIADLIDSMEIPESLVKIRKMDGAWVINDTYNSNPTGLRSALDLLDSMPSRSKVLILDDIWELGEQAERIHSQIAKEIARRNYDKIILVGTNYSEFLRGELRKNNVAIDKIIKIKNSSHLWPWKERPKGASREFNGGEIKRILAGFKDRDCAILFEGRRAGKYLDEICS